MITEKTKSYSLGLISVGYFWLLIEGGGADFATSMISSLHNVVGAIVAPYVLAALFVFGCDLIYRGIIGSSWFNKFGDGLAGVWAGSWRIFGIFTGILIFFLAVKWIAE